MKNECFYCDDTGFIKGKEVRPQDKLPEQICPYCEIGQAVHRGYRKASETQVNNYDKLKASHEKLLKKFQHELQTEKIADMDCCCTDDVDERCLACRAASILNNNAESLGWFLGFEEAKQALKEEQI